MVHNSRRPRNRLNVTLLTLTLTFDLIFDQIFIGWRGIVTDYPCAEFGILVSAVLVLSHGQTDTQTESQRRINAILPRLPSA